MSVWRYSLGIVLIEFRKKKKKLAMEMNCNWDGNRRLVEEAFREEQALEGPESPRENLLAGS